MKFKCISYSRSVYHFLVYTNVDSLELAFVLIQEGKNVGVESMSDDNHPAPLQVE